MARRPPAMWLRLRNVPRLRALRLEEALFRVDKRSWFITNEWDNGGSAAERTIEPRSTQGLRKLWSSIVSDNITHFKVIAIGPQPMHG